MSRQSQEKMEELFFSVYYDADDIDLKNHRLPADRVADAIKQMYILIEEADKTLNGSNNTIDLYVSSPAEKGSLGINFLAELINPQNAELVLHYLGIASVVGGVVKGVLTPPSENENVFKVAQEINGATVIDVETSDDSDIATLLIDNRKIECNENVARLMANPKIRKAVHGFVTKPIDGYKSPTISIGSDAKNNPTTKLSSKNIEKIDNLLVAKNEPKQNNIKETVTFTQVNFDGEKGWKMRLDGKQVKVEIADEAFIKRINSNRQKFVKSDEYNVELTVSTSYGEDGKEKKSYTINKAKRKRKLK